MVGFLKDGGHGRYPHLDIRAADELRHFDDNGEFNWGQGEETELEGDLNPGYEVIDHDDWQLQDEESFTLDELMAMTDFDNEPDYAMTYNDYDYDYRESEWLYQGQVDCVESEEVDENEEGLGRPTSGARYRHHLTRYGSERKSRIWSCGERRGTNIQRCPKWQQRAGGGKRGRKSIRFATPELPETFQIEGHYDMNEVSQWHQDWLETQAALAYIEKVMAEHVVFDDIPLKWAA